MEKLKGLDLRLFLNNFPKVEVKILDWMAIKYTVFIITCYTVWSNLIFSLDKN